MPDYKKTAISWFGLKEAMLYFPYVIPFCEEMDVVMEPTHENSVQLKKAIHEQLLPPDMRNKSSVEYIDKIGIGVRSFIQSFLQEIVGKGATSDGTFDQMAKEFTQGLRGDAGKDLREAIITFFVKCPSYRDLPLIVSGAYANKAKSGDIALTISSLKLIDTEHIDFAQLFEFRKDLEAMEKLRRLRLFVYENYTDKSRDFIEDDILTRIADYERAVKEWGFTTATGAINTVLDSKLIAGGVAGSFLSTYLQAPLITVAAAIGTVGMAIGKVAIDLGKQKIARNEIMASNPVSYISYAREKLGEK